MDDELAFVSYAWRRVRTTVLLSLVTMGWVALFAYMLLGGK